jgi:hypothetical protein
MFSAVKEPVIILVRGVVFEIDLNKCQLKENKTLFFLRHRQCANCM